MNENEQTIDNDTDRVSPANACPKCGEGRVNWLEWLDFTHVGCCTCDAVYEPENPDTENVDQSDPRVAATTGAAR